MAINNFHFKLDIEREDYIPKFRLKQYDTAIFYASIYKNGLPYHFENEQIKMFVKKQDGTIVWQEDNISIQDDEVRINVNNQALVCSGLTYAELEFKSSDGQVTSSTFLYEVKEKVGSDKAIESVTDIATLDKLKKYMEDAKKELERFKNEFSKIEDLVANKDKLEGQNEDAKKNIVELGKVLEDANNITSDEGKFITGNNVVSESTNGYIQGLKICGKSLVNRFRFRSQGVANTNIYVYSNESVNDNTTGGNTLRIFNNTNKKVIFDINSNGVYKRSEILGSYEKYRDITLLADEYLYCVYGQTRDGWNSELESDRKLLKNSCIAIDDFTVENIDTYFEGIASVGNGNEIEVLTRKEDGNLFNINNFKQYVLGLGSEYSSYVVKDSRNCWYPINFGIYHNNFKYYLKLKPNTQYNLKFEYFFETTTGSHGLYFRVAYTDGTFGYPLRGAYNSWGVATLTTDINKTVDYIHMTYTDSNTKTWIDLDSIVMAESKYYNDKLENKQDKKTILFKDTDNKCKPITNLPGYWENGKFIWGDKIEQHSDGKYYYHKRGYKFTLDGSEAWGDNGTPRDGCSTFYIRGFSGIGKFKILCDKFNYNISPMLSTVGISSQSNILYLTVKTSYASNVTELKNKLKTDNISLIFEDTEKIYECLDISTRAFRNKTMLSINSGAIDPGVYYYIPTGFLSADNSISSKVETLDKYSEKNIRDIEDLTSNIENNYFNINRGLLTDFNNGIQEGKYYLHSTSLIPNSPPTLTSGLYGIVQVFSKNYNELFQIVTLHSLEMWTRFKNAKGEWQTWVKLPNMQDFKYRHEERGFQIYPGGLMFQWGSMSIQMGGGTQTAKQDIVYPLAYSNPVFFAGANIDNVDGNGEGITDDFTVHVFNYNRLPGATVRIKNILNPYGSYATVKWFAIGI
ncbi:MAG: BppU family phage baseplate upper protein [Paraclostridium bifermentans]